MVVDHTIIARHDWAVGSASSFHHLDMSIKIHPTHVKNNYSLYSLGSRNHLWVFIFFFSSNILSPSIGCYEYLCVLLLLGMNPSTHWSCTIAPILKCIINITPTLHMEGRRGYRNLWSAAYYLPLVSQESVSYNYFGILKWKVRFSFPIGSCVCFKLSSYRDDQW